MDKYKAFDAFSPFIGRPFRDNSIIPIIYYHSIVNAGGASYQQTDISVFFEHMMFLKNEGYVFLSFSEIPSMFYKKKNEKRLLIAFDDGYANNYTSIFEFMCKEHIKYNVFLATSLIGSSGYLDINQLLMMKKSGMVEFGTHTHTHIDCAKEYEKLPNEIGESNRLYNEIFGEEPNDFCFPFGSYSTESVRFIRDNGKYKRIYTSDFMRPRNLDGVCITGRLGIRNEDTIQVLKHKIEGDYYPLRLFVDKRVRL